MSFQRCYATHTELNRDNVTQTTEWRYTTVDIASVDTVAIQCYRVWLPSATTPMLHLKMYKSEADELCRHVSERLC